MKYILATFCIFSQLLLTSAMTHAADTISIAPIHGYTEVKQDIYKEYTGALTLETALHLDVFLHLFVKSEEYHRVQNFDVDELTSTITFVWFQGVKGNAGINLVTPHTLPKDGIAVERPSFLTDSKKEAFFHALGEKANVKRLESIAASFAEFQGTFIDNRATIFDKKRIQGWLDEGSAAQQDFDFGLAKRAENYAIYVWLQAPINNSYSSYGMPAAKPVAVSYATIKIDDKILGVIFADRISSADDVEKHFSRAIKYIEENHSRFSVIKANPVQNAIQSFSVLGYMSLQWAKQNKFDKAISAYKILIDQYNELGLNFLKIAYAAELCDCYMRQGNYNAIVQEAPRFLSEALNIPESADNVVGLYTMLGESYGALGDNSRAEQYLSRALNQSILVHGILSKITIYIQDKLFYILMMNNKNIEAVKIIKKSIASAIEIGDTKLSGLFFGNLAIASARSAHKSLSIFYCKLSISTILAAGGLNDRSDSNTNLYNSLIEFFKVIAVRDKIASNEEAVENILATQNVKGDNPYNTRHDWMRGPEIKLYTQYEEVGSALERAGTSGTEDDKKAARVAFDAWLDSVQKTLEQ